MSMCTSKIAPRTLLDSLWAEAAVPQHFSTSWASLIQPHIRSATELERLGCSHVGLAMALLLIINTEDANETLVDI